MRDGRNPDPPHDPATEAALIGAAILRPTVIDEAVDAGLEPHDIYNPAHRAIWMAAFALHYRPGTTVDAVAIAAHLGPQGLEQIGGAATLTTLQANCPGTTGTAGRVAILREKANRRRAAHTADQLRAAALDGTNWTDHLDRLHTYTTTDTTRPGVAPLTVRWIHDSLDHPPTEPPLLVDGFLRRGELAVVVAPRKLGKSWTTMQLAIGLARGEGRFLGRLDHTAPARVLLCQGELNPWGSHGRWAKLLHGQDRPEGIAETFDRWQLRMEKVRDDSTHEGHRTTRERTVAVLDPRLEQTITDLGIDVVIIDPWAVFFAGAENSNDEVEAALSELRMLAHRTGIAIVVVHHISKVGDVREPEDMWRGASRLADWADTGLTMLPHYKREADWKKAGLTRQRAKWYVDLAFMRRDRATDDFSVAWDPETGWWQAWDPEPAGKRSSGHQGLRSDDGDGHSEEWNPEQVADLLAECGGVWTSANQAARAIREAGGPKSHSSVRRHLDAAASTGLIVCESGENRATVWRLPDAVVAADVADALFERDDYPVNAFADGTTPDDWEHHDVDDLIMEDA